MQKKIEIQTDRRRLKSLFVGDITFRSSNDHALSERDVQQALLELGETICIRNFCLYKLKQMLSRDEKVAYRTDDEYLLRFLRARKFNVDRAYKTINDFYSVRKRYPEVFELPSNLESLLNLNFYTRLPYLDEEGRILFKVDYAKWNPAEVTFVEILTLMIVISDIVITNPKCQINGIVGIWDMKEMSASHLGQFINPARLILFFKILQGCYPWRMKAIIGVNCGKFSQVFYKIVKPFVKLKIIERVLLLGSDMSELHEHINPAVLPKQFGGNLEDEECSISQHILSNLPYLNYERSFGTKSKDEE